MRQTIKEPQKTNPLHTYQDEYYVSYKSVIEKFIYFHPYSSNMIIPLDSYISLL